MRYIVIDPADRTIRQDNATALDLAAVRRLIGCRLVDCVRLADGCDLWLDDEALFDPIDQHYFQIGERLFAGRGLVCGASPGGNSVGLADAYPFDLIERNVTFIGGINDARQAIAAQRVGEPASGDRKVWAFEREAADL